MYKNKKAKVVIQLSETIDVMYQMAHSFRELKQGRIAKDLIDSAERFQLFFDKIEVELKFNRSETNEETLCLHKD